MRVSHDAAGVLVITLTFAEACALGSAIMLARPSGSVRFETPAGPVLVVVEGMPGMAVAPPHRAIDGGAS